MRALLFLTAVVLTLATGCSSDRPAASKNLTAAQRDSILATEPLPGATVVGKALDVTDQSRVRANMMNAAVDSLPR